MGATKSTFKEVEKKDNDKFFIKNIHYLPNKTYELVIYGTMLLIFLLMALYYVKNVSLNAYTETDFSINLTNKDQKKIYDEEYNTCPSGYCAMSRNSGLKRCPKNISDILVYDPAIEICTLRNMCLNGTYPNPVKTDGGTITTSNFCENGSDCRCSDRNYCSDYITTVFEGSPYKEGVYAQIPSSLNKQVSNIEYDYTTQRCRISSGYSDKITGGCDFSVDKQNKLSDTDGRGTSANYKNMLLCFNKNPCYIGRFVYNDDSDHKTFMQYQNNKKASTLNDMLVLLNQPASKEVSCVYGEACSNLKTIDKSRFYPNFDKNIYSGEKNKDTESAINNTGISLYYPIWSNDRRRVECVRMYPLFIFDVILSETLNSVESVSIQATGRDYSHYLYSIEKDRFMADLNDDTTSLELRFISIDGFSLDNVLAHVSEIIDGRITEIQVDSPGSSLTGKPHAILTGFRAP